MKQASFIFLAIFISLNLIAQVPQKMSYQLVVRNSSNAIVANQNVGIRLSILQGNATGSIVFEEVHNKISNINGLVSFVIGEGTPVSGNISAVDWANGPYFIKTEADPSGGTNYTITGTTQLLSVPYALYAGRVSYSFQQATDVDSITTNTIFVQGLRIGKGNAALTYNTAIGNGALDSTLAGDENTAIGFSALKRNISGSANVAVGFGTLYNNTTGYNNTAVGNEVLNRNNTGRFNTGVGTLTLHNLTTGEKNFAGSFLALNHLITGTGNVALGYASMYFSITSDSCTSIGLGALHDITTGRKNVALGGDAGGNIHTSSFNMALGDSAYVNDPASNFQMVIGNSIYGKDINGRGINLSIGNMGAFVKNPTARWHLPAGQSLPEKAPLKFSAGATLLAAENGAMEYDGTHLYFTIGTNRYQLDQQPGESLNGSITTVTSNTVLNDSYCTVLVDASAGNVVITFPAASNANRKKIYIIKKTDASLNTVSFNADGTAITLVNQFSGKQVQSDGNAWYVIGSF
jgi:hypothetical protein